MMKIESKREFKYANSASRKDSKYPKGKLDVIKNSVLFCVGVDEVTMKEDILFSVLIANYNNGKYINYAIQSVLEQTYPNIEIIVVDDHSNDGSISIIDQFVQVHPNIRLYQNEINQGCGYTKRRAAELATGSIIGFLDPDDVLMPTAVELMVRAHEVEEQASLIGSSHFVCDENLQVLREAYGACAIPPNENYLTYGKGVTAFSSFKSRHYHVTEGIDAEFKRAVDQDLYYKLEEVGTVSFIPELLYKYRVHRGSLSNFDNIAKARYWMVMAKEAAFHRRLEMNNIKNITKADLKSWWSILYATKAGVALGARKYGAACYWMSRCVFKSPIDNFVKLKLQSLMIHRKPSWIKS